MMHALIAGINNKHLRAVARKANESEIIELTWTAALQADRAHVRAVRRAQHLHVMFVLISDE